MAMLMASVPLRKFNTEKMFVLLRTKRMQFRNHADTQTVQRSKGYAIYIYSIKLRMLEVRENDLALRKLSGGTGHLEGNTACLLEKTYPALKICRLPTVKIIVIYLATAANEAHFCVCYRHMCIFFVT